MQGTARDRILDAAQRLVLRHGFAATTVDAVLAEAEASKGAFFHHFPSKAALGEALVRRYADQDAATLDAALAEVEAATDDPAEQLVLLARWFEDRADAVVASQPACLFVSFIYESELDGSTTDALVTEAILHWRQRILAKLEQAAAERAGLAGVDLPSLADHWFTTFEGAFLLGQALGDETSMRHQLAHLRRYLELLFGLDPDPRPAPARRRRVRAPERA